MSDLEVKAQNASAIIAPAELHGLVCGLCAGRPAQFSMQAFVDLAGADALTDEEAVERFVVDTLAGFTADDMRFAPLIADDEQALSVRLAGLSNWCAGFLSGFGAGAAAPDNDVLPVDVQEIVRDFAHICSLDDDVDGDDQDEASFMELYEYVRVASVLVLALMAEALNAQTDARP